MVRISLEDRGGRLLWDYSWRWPWGLQCRPGTWEWLGAVLSCSEGVDLRWKGQGTQFGASAWPP